MATPLQIDHFMHGLKKRNPHQPEFHQAVFEVATSVIPYINRFPEYLDARILERMTEPDRTIIFRVVWEDDQGEVHVNRGMRVQFNGAIGPYKGGLRFHHEVDMSILKFLGFEQTFKNSLTTLPMGAAKGGADFNPKGKSDREVMRFCQSFMTELHKHIGEDTDVPAGDIGVGPREISFLFGQYKRLENRFVGVVTGKGIEYGGSLIRVEATGYGCAYFMEEMLQHTGACTEGKTCVLSGAGNVAQHCAEKILHLGGKPVTMSDSTGFIHDPDGISHDKLEFIKQLKNIRRGRISEYADEFGCAFYADQRPWGIACDLAYPCATQNEIDGNDARTLIGNGCIALAEGANMPCNLDAIAAFQESGTLFAPGKASNAGGVAVSGLEMSQNSIRMSWGHEELENRLRDIIGNIHRQCVQHGSEDGAQVNYVRGANIAGFEKVARAMLAYGVM